MADVNNFEALIVIAERIALNDSVMQTFSELSVEQTVFAIYETDLVEEMFLAAAYRLAERKGLGVIRVNIEDGVPSFYISLGHSQEDAQQRLRQWLQHREEERKVEG